CCGHGRCQEPSCSTGSTEGRLPNVVDLPDVASEAHDVGRIADELERGRLVQAARDDTEAAIAVDPNERAGIRQRRSTWSDTFPNPLREGVERPASAEFHVDEESGARGYLSDDGRIRAERHDLAVRRQVGDGAGLGQVNGIARYRETRRNDVAE